MNKPLIYIYVGLVSLAVYSVIFIFLDKYTNQGVLLAKLWFGFIGGTTIILGRYLSKRFCGKGQNETEL